jgi:hypothetical protein
MPSKSKPFETVAGVFWGAHPSCLILLAKDRHAGAAKGSVLGIEDCIGSDGIYTE